jgi:hypothetical protein
MGEALARLCAVGLGWCEQHSRVTKEVDPE